MYGKDGKLDDQFLLSTKTVLADIAELVDEIRQDSPLNLVCRGEPL